MNRWAVWHRARMIGDGGLVLLLAGLSWSIRANLFATGLNEVNGTHLGQALWWSETAVASIGFVLARRRLPEGALAAVAAVTLLHTWQGWPLLPTDFLGAVCLYEVARLRRFVVAAGSLVGSGVVAYAATGATVAGYRSGLPSPFDAHGGFPAVASVLIVAWFAGVAVAEARRRRDHRAREAAVAERARITREIHDIVAHGLSVMVVQAQGAAAALRTRPERTEAALDAIVATGRSSLAEMRGLLDTERSQTDGCAPLAPTPGIPQLAELIDRISAAGLQTALLVDGREMKLPASVDLSVYRVVQEALTNAMRHAGGGAKATVRVGYAADGVDVVITDSGTGITARPNGGGHGLAGIRERVSSLSGELQFGRGPEGGFQIRARFPIPPETV